MSLQNLLNAPNPYPYAINYALPLVQLLQQNTPPGVLTTVVLSNQSDALFLVPQQLADNIITMPAPQFGLKYRFVLQAVADGTHTLILNFAANSVFGMLINATPAVVNVNGDTHITLNATAANTKIGDYLDCWSDGINWYISGFSSSATGAWAAT